MHHNDAAERLYVAYVIELGLVAAHPDENRAFDDAVACCLAQLAFAKEHDPKELNLWRSPDSGVMRQFANSCFCFTRQQGGHTFSMHRPTP